LGGSRKEGKNEVITGKKLGEKDKTRLISTSVGKKKGKKKGGEGADGEKARLKAGIPRK